MVRQITAVQAHPKRPGMYQVWVSEDEASSIADESMLIVHEDTLVSMRLLKDRRLSETEWEQLQREEALEEAYRAALYMIERKARTSHELRDRLKRKGFAPDVVSACIQRMAARRLIDDAAFARRYAEQKLVGQRKGSRLIRQELLQRGISREEASQAVSELDEAAEAQAAVALARKKWPTLKGQWRQKQQKLTGYLLRRGFPNSVVRAALDQIRADMDEQTADESFASETCESMDDIMDADLSE